MKSEPYRETFLEGEFPFREISLVLRADRRMSDPAYRVHRWWARRPPGLMRALLIAAASDAETTSEGFWNLFGSNARPLAGRKVLDPFAGGGTTLVEAARLGADVWGGDVDPLAVAITRYELRPASQNSVEQAGADLMAELSTRLARYYPGEQGVPLHYFRLPVVRCPSCSHEGVLYRSLVLARSSGKPGSVVREAAINAFCPDCFELQDLATPDRTRIHCCGSYHALDSGTFENGHYACISCGQRSSHRELLTGAASDRLVAVEETVDDAPRRLRLPTSNDEVALERAQNYWSRHSVDLELEDRQLPVAADGRPHSFGISRLYQMFWPRQLLVFGVARRWVLEADLDEDQRTALLLALSNAVTTNNRLCGYAVDYGRISPLFSIRGYSLPALSIELNPLHESAGRGTVPTCIERVAQGGRSTVRRHVWKPTRKRRDTHEYDFGYHTGIAVDFSLRSATRDVPERKRHSADLCVFDPPYFDYMDYDELSQLQRIMIDLPRRGGQPLQLKRGEDIASFTDRLAICFRRCVDSVQQGMPLVFTYHASRQEAWDAIGTALDEAKLRVTAAWPVLSDGRMGHHSFPGNCEWDVVVVCRSIDDVVPKDFTTELADWIRALKPLVVGKADRQNLSHALAMLRNRFAEVVGGR
jgi:putative DNA methylase